MANVTFSVRLPAETKSLLDTLSKNTRRSKNFLARKAITSFVQSEAEIVGGIMQGVADIKAGRSVPRDVVRKKSREIIAAAHKRKIAKA
jgi:predicted transcriptional regulator